MERSARLTSGIDAASPRDFKGRLPRVQVIHFVQPRRPSRSARICRELRLAESRDSSRKWTREVPQQPMQLHSRGKEIDAQLPHNRIDSHNLGELAIARALMARGRISEAKSVFERIVARKPLEPFAYSTLGAILAEDDEKRALSLFDAALEIAPSDLFSLLGRAEINLRAGNIGAAVRDIDKAIAADPDNQSILGDHARALHMLAHTWARAG